MTLLYPSFLWLLIPLVLLLFTQKRKTLLTSTHLLTLVFIVFSLSRPVIEEGLQENTIEAKDIIIALDVSYSMKAEDVKPTRYAFAKETIRSFLKENAKDNIMLMAFTSNPLLLSPPTTDHALINVALESLNPEYILTKGTSLKKLFSKIASMKNTDKHLILITDGGEEENAEMLAEQLRQTDLRLTILALGSKQGITIEKADGSMLKDKDNNLVVSRINPMLKQLAALSKGEYLTLSSSPEATGKVLQNSIYEDTQKAQKIKKMQYHYTELYQIPLFLALILFLMLHTRASKILLLFFSFIGVNLHASVWNGYHLHNAYSAYHSQDFNTTKKSLRKVKTPSLQSQFALGNTYYKLQNYKKAIRTYKAIRSTSRKTKQKLFYNTANAYAMLQEYDKAKIYYTKALQLGKDKESLYNLKIVALLKKKEDAPLGIAHPKSQNSDASKSETEPSEDEESKQRDEDQPSSGSGSGGESQKEKQKEEEKKRLKMDSSEEQQPLSSKVYELINKGYIRETQPW